MNEPPTIDQAIDWLGAYRTRCQTEDVAAVTDEVLADPRRDFIVSVAFAVLAALPEKVWHLERSAWMAHVARNSGPRAE